MPAYWLARAKIHDPVEHKKSTDQVPAILAEHHEKVERFIVVEFPTLEAAVACRRSPEYQSA